MVPASQTLKSGGRLAIIAGYGQLPLDVAYAALDHGEDPFIFKISGEADQNWDQFDKIDFQIGDFAKLKHHLTKNKIGRVILAGGVKRRPQLSQVRPTLGALFALPNIIRKILSGGDDALLKSFIALIEAQGCQVIGAHIVAPNLIADEGAIGRFEPSKQDKADIEAGANAALHLGQLDIGQAAVAVGGRVIALEALEGTDEMLLRVAKLRKQGRLPNSKKGVLVKYCKPRQDMRADLPTIGPDTIKNVHDAGLAGIVVEAGRSLILKREDTIARADENKVFIIGLVQEPDNGR